MSSTVDRCPCRKNKGRYRLGVVDVDFLAPLTRRTHLVARCTVRTPAPAPTRVGSTSSSAAPLEGPQKILWAEVRKETRRGKDCFQMGGGGGRSKRGDETVARAEKRLSFVLLLVSAWCALLFSGQTGSEGKGGPQRTEGTVDGERVVCM